MVILCAFSGKIVSPQNQIVMALRESIGTWRTDSALHALGAESSGSAGRRMCQRVFLSSVVILMKNSRLEQLLATCTSCSFNRPARSYERFMSALSHY
jgi:hypothetical protein